ncbi:lipid kinase [Bacillus sp. FJAT-27225]|uniref:diacylglycerol/lipid kinase family protein n=1 Tax=Bacillus sp. FJAT-27225 TaxID=1743144 RepID=UPI00080C277B|nr:YegS/Rv2252/BmrU family lipid kinase [Bacillus sp. FJAT-27225]OCA89338.1 lipid kinase [Bacillus sp. FJAT-27225]
MARYNRALLIYNGNAGQKDIEKRLGACIPVLSRDINELILLKTLEPGHAEQLCKTYGERSDLVIILGGDGTVHEVINGLAGLEKRPIIGILPGGTCNDFSRTLNMPQDIQRAAEDLLAGKPVPIDVLEINGHYALNFWGTGLVTETSNNIKESEKQLFGKASYYLSAMRTMRQMEPFRYHINCNGKTLEGEAVMILVANGKFIGTNQLPFRNIHIDDGEANLFIIRNTNMGLIKDILTRDITVMDENDTSGEVLHSLGSEITISTDQRMEADTDGEVYLKTPAVVKVLKHHILAITPDVDESIIL